MAITRWEPFQDIDLWEPFSWQPMREIERMQQRMNRIFDRLMPTVDREVFGLGFVPSVEMEETDQAVILKLEIPGMEAKDLHVEVSEDSVSIRGDRKSEARIEEKGMLRSEFHYGMFERVIPLPVHIQNDKVTAEYKHGILRLTLPKAEEAKKKIVKVKLD
ncbi:MAG: Hsp20/alpha crystallin family protein [Fischerella sp.]|nr:Hsp20/alpha crystallin family protein [Fischerella sp.]